MKSDTTSTVMTFILGVLLILGVVFTLLSITRQRELRTLTLNAAYANARLMRTVNLLNETAAFNASAKSAELTRILQAMQQPKSPAPSR